MPPDVQHAPGLTVHDVARRYRVGEDKVRAWIGRGELKAVNTAAALCGKPRWVIPARGPRRLRGRPPGRPDAQGSAAQAAERPGRLLPRLTGEEEVQKRRCPGSQPGQAGGAEATPTGKRQEATSMIVSCERKRKSPTPAAPSPGKEAGHV
jgi:hypothetical protein